jgi:hypothetical protein
MEKTYDKKLVTTNNEMNTEEFIKDTKKRRIL